MWETQTDLKTGKIYWTNHVIQKTTATPTTVSVPGTGQVCGESNIGCAGTSTNDRVGTTTTY